jgi:hypothetical protein
MSVPENPTATAAPVEMVGTATTSAVLQKPVRDRGRYGVKEGIPTMTQYATAITFPQTSTTYETFSKLSSAVGSPVMEGWT